MRKVDKHIKSKIRVPVKDRFIISDSHKFGFSTPYHVMALLVLGAEIWGFEKYK